MNEQEINSDPYEFQEKKSKKARTKTWLILGAGGLLGVFFVTTAALGLRGSDHELLKREGELHLIVPDGEHGAFGFKPFDRDHNREHFEGEDHDGDRDHEEPNFESGITD